MFSEFYPSSISYFSRQRIAFLSITFLASAFAHLMACSKPERSASELLDDALDVCRTTCEVWRECPGFNPNLEECIEQACEEESERWVMYGEPCLLAIETYYTCMIDRPCESDLPEDVCVKEFYAWAEACSDGGGDPKND